MTTTSGADRTVQALGRREGLRVTVWRGTACGTSDRVFRLWVARRSSVGAVVSAAHLASGKIIPHLWHVGSALAGSGGHVRHRPSGASRRSARRTGAASGRSFGWSRTQNSTTRSGLAGPRRREGGLEVERMTQVTRRPSFAEGSPTGRSQAADRVRHRTVLAGGLEVPILEAGSGPLVVCLHGFPDHAASWAGLLGRLAQEGYWAVAPAQRGYWPGGAAPDGSYRASSTGQDVLALIEALGREEADLDLGARAAYAAANLDATRVRKLVGMAEVRQILHALETCADH
ncbi:alpha/beta fold hydrolase [Streptomyces sp. NPDC002888]|uniref:alpha/beta fold hydrolase n=1 Tax=Streptomyces sp. NPDC002888 TaxID=3364668 RepID=UPI00368C725C